MPEEKPLQLDAADLLIQRAMEDPIKAAAIAKLLEPASTPKQSTEKYSVKVRHTIVCLLCDNIYVESYSAPYTQHMSKHNPPDRVEQVNYKHTTQTCHNCRERLMEIPRGDAIVKAIERIRILSRGGQ